MHNILFLGRDRMTYFIAQELKQKYDTLKLMVATTNEDLQHIFFEEYDFIILPITGMREDYVVESMDDDLIITPSILEQISRDATIFTGRIDGILKKLFPSNRLINYLSDQEVQEQKNFLMAEGVLHMIRNKKKDSVCLIGYNDITRMIMALLPHTHYKVGVNDIYALIELQDHGFYTSDVAKFHEVVRQSDLIVNTLNENVITERVLKDNEQIFILDVATYPYGVSDDLQHRMDMNYVSDPHLFETYSPCQMARVLSKKIWNETKNRNS